MRSEALPAVGRRVAAASLLAAFALAGCGSSSTATSVTPTPRNAQSLPAARPIPADYTSLSAVARQLSGIASCHQLAPTTGQCHLVTMPTVPFLVEIFTDQGQRASYLDNLEATDAMALKTGAEPNSGLAGPSWVATTTVVAPGLLPDLQHYLGGTRVS